MIAMLEKWDYVAENENSSPGVLFQDFTNSISNNEGCKEEQKTPTDKVIFECEFCAFQTDALSSLSAHV